MHTIFMKHNDTLNKIFASCHDHEDKRFSTLRTTTAHEKSDAKLYYSS